MHFSKIYLQENFVPDFITDQFKRKVIGIEITINEGESLDEAKQTAENYIKEYIQANTIIPHQHIEVKDIDSNSFKWEKFKELNISNPYPPTESLEDQIMSCQELKVLESYYLIVKNNEALKNVYDIRRKQLVEKESKEIIDKTNALCQKS